MDGVESLWDIALDLDEMSGVATVATVLAEAGVNIDSVCCMAGASPFACHVLVADAQRAAAALEAAAIVARAREVAVFALQNRPGTLAAVSAALDGAGVTVDLLYQATDRGLVVGADDLDAVRTAVASTGRLATRDGTASVG